ncbi:MAG: hypothetical protein RBT65_14990 [Methanolobus sp.]|nr:hypothetical protein [Methanolobus sp.]
MLKKIRLIFIIMMLFAGCAIAEENNTKDKNPYKVTPLTTKDDSQDDIVQIKTTFDSIAQGETNWHSEYIGSYITTLDVDLDWGDSSDSLKLTIYTADGHTLGPYYDSADGPIDGRIHLRIKNSNGIATGTWNYRVYGYSVSGTETYSI